METGSDREEESHVYEKPKSSGAVAPNNQSTKKLPSKAVRNKKKDSHKKHLNQKTVENRLKPKLDAKRYFPEEDLAAVLEECRRTAMQQPAKEIGITVNKTSVHTLCNETVHYLYNVGKIQPNPDGMEADVVNLSSVVEAQAVAKIHIARRSNGKVVEVHDTEYVSRVEKRFTVLPKILNIYLEQIGQFTHEGQTFVPRKLPSIKFSRLVPGTFLTGLERSSPGGIREIAIARVVPEHLGTYVVDGVYVGEPIAMVTEGHGSIEWARADSLNDFSSLCEWYERFVSRCNRKASGLLQTVVYAKGEGTVAQLVGSRDDPRTLQREIWCNKVIDQNVLQIGGLFGYGYESQDPFHSEEIAAVVDRMDMDGLNQRIQRCQRM